MPTTTGLSHLFAAVTAPTLAVSVTDLEFGTVAAVERLLAYFINSARVHVWISPGAIVESAIRFRDSCGPLKWLRFGVPASCPSLFITPHEGPNEPEESPRTPVPRGSTEARRPICLACAGHLGCRPFQEKSPP
jgi:hypothetical protein